MNVLICTVQVPFTQGGGESHTNNLKDAFISAGHNAEICAIPFKWYPPEDIMRSALVWRLLDLTSANGKPIDMVVGMKFPAYLVPHPRKVIWLMHQFRTAYELSDTPYDDLSHYPDGALIRNFIKHSDEKYIPASRAVFANSRTVADRLMRYNGIHSEPLYHPPPHFERLRTGDQGDYVFFPSRMEPIKRQDLLIEAASHLKTPVRIMFAGSSSNMDYYKGLIRKFQVGDRIDLLGYIDEQRLIDLYSNALAVCYLPFDEDYGYVTLEAMYSGKPVIVAKDGAGATEFITDGREGFVVEPSPPVIAETLDRLYLDRNLALQMGNNAREKIVSMDLSWQNVVDTLVSAIQ